MTMTTFSHKRVWSVHTERAPFHCFADLLLLMHDKRLLAALSKNQDIIFKNAVSELTLMAANEKEPIFLLKTIRDFRRMSYMAFF